MRLTAFFLASILITLCFLAILASQYNGPGLGGSDYTSFYKPIAKNILSGKGITLDGAFSTRVPPGYPLLLAGVFGLATVSHIPEAVLISAFGLGCVGLSAIFVFLTAKSVWGNKGAFLSWGLFLTYPLLMPLVRAPNSETPFLVFFYASFFLLWRNILLGRSKAIFYFLPGVILGLAMLIRPIAIGVGLVFCITIWLAATNLGPKIRLVAIAFLLLGNIATVVPWLTSVYDNTGKMIPLSSVGPVTMRSGWVFAVKTDGFRQGVDVPEDVRFLMERIMSRYSEMTSFPKIVSVILEEGIKSPFAAVKLMALKVARSWYATDSQRHENIILPIQIFYFTAIVLALFFSFKRGKKAGLLAISVSMIIGYFWLIDIIACSIVRYMIPALGLGFTMIPGIWCPEAVYKETGAE